MLDGAVKTVLVDESQPVGEIMVVVCSKIGISNHEEYSMVSIDIRINFLFMNAILCCI